MNQPETASAQPPQPRSPALDQAERLLATRGHELGFAGARIAAGRSGVVVGFPRDPMVHLSWWVLGTLLLGGVWLGRRRS